jgi:hypothetical protein
MIYCFAWTIFYFIAGSVLAVASVSHPHAAGWAIAAVRKNGAIIEEVLLTDLGHFVHN